jgi:ubiquinone/menaquinone biosynthesis C-methylase UbiE
MKLQSGQLVADLGAGVGWYSLRIAKRVAPSGAVFAVDVQQGMLDQLQARMKEAGVRNIYPVLGGEADPMLPEGKMDWILLVDVYHELAQPQAMLAKIRQALAPEGKVALVEYRAEQDPATLPVRIPRDHQMTIAEVLREWLPAGFELVEFHEFLPAQHYFIFRKARVN